MSTEAGRQMAQRVLDYIHEHPEQHNQSSYMGPGHAQGETVTSPVCKTNMCIAGTAVYLEAFDRKVSVKDILNEYPGSVSSFDDAGRDILGISAEEAGILFHEYDDEQSVQLLKKVVVGETLTHDMEGYQEVGLTDGDF